MADIIKNDPRVINDFSVRGKETPLQNKIRQFVIENPNCTVADICKGMNWKDDSGVRRAIRRIRMGKKAEQGENHKEDGGRQLPRIPQRWLVDVTLKNQMTM